jgi:hypothetical protein
MDAFRMSYSLLMVGLVGLVGLAILAPMVLRHLAHSRRQGTLARMLDLADEVERLLDLSQERMEALRPVVQRVPADIASVASASLEGALPIREAKRDLLQHRLWIQQNGASASQAELDKACGALARVSQNLRNQVAELERVGRDLASATDAAAEAALREPPTLRRPGP